MIWNYAADEITGFVEAGAQRNNSIEFVFFFFFFQVKVVLY